MAGCSCSYSKTRSLSGNQPKLAMPTSEQNPTQTVSTIPGSFDGIPRIIGFSARCMYVCTNPAEPDCVGVEVSENPGRNRNPTTRNRSKLEETSLLLARLWILDDRNRYALADLTLLATKSTPRPEHWQLAANLNLHLNKTDTHSNYCFSSTYNGNVHSSLTNPASK